jgi:hypothetical protein
LPTRLFVYAHEKWGKTWLAAFAPRPVFLMTRGETGLETLIAAGQLPETDHFRDPAAEWADVLHAVRVLSDEEHTFGTLVIDTANGASGCAWRPSVDSTSRAAGPRSTPTAGE